MSADEKESESFIDKCSDTVQKYCTVENIPQSGLREILTIISEVYRANRLSEVNADSISIFIQTQCNFIQNSKEFPFDVFEICFTFYAAKDMPQMLYNDKQITTIIKCFGNFFNVYIMGNEENISLLHRLFPILKLASRMIERCALSETMLSILIEIAQTCYFHKASSVPLQSSACSLLCAIFKRYSDMRNDILNHIFYTAEKTKKMNMKNVVFSKKGKIQINTFSVLIFELMQSTYIYGTTTEDSETDMVSDMINRLLQLPPKFLEQFSKDMFACLTHPFYPICLLILPRYLNFLYSHVVNKTKYSKISIRTFCTGLAAINTIVKQLNIEEEIPISQDIFRFVQMNSEQNPSEVVSSLIVAIEFPKTEKERILAELIILTFVRNSFTLLDSYDTATQAHLYQWSEKRELDQDENEFLGNWASGSGYVVDITKITYDHVARLYIALLSKKPIFSNTQEIIKRLLGGLKNRSATVRGLVMDGFAVVIDQNTEYLYHPELIKLLQPAFIDPCTTVRDAALKIVSTYIKQHEQIKSPYFPQIVNCLHDSSNSIVKKSIFTLATLAQTATQKELVDLCKMLVHKLDKNEPNEVRRAAKQLLLNSIFDYSENPSELFFAITNELTEETEWWSSFIKESYIKYKNQILEIVQIIVKQTCEDPNPFNVALLYDFVKVLPSICASEHEKLIAALFLAQDDPVIAVLAQIINLLVPCITFPVIPSFSLLMRQLEDLINSRGTGVVRPVIQLLVSISTYILPDNSSLLDMELAYTDILLKTKQPSKPEERQQVYSLVNRSIFVLGVLIKEVGWLITTSSLTKISGIIKNFYMWDSRDVKARVLEAFINICIRDPSQIQNAKSLLNQAFARGDEISAMNFIKELIQEEYKLEDTTAIDEVQTVSAPSLINNHLKNIKDCFKKKDKNVRNAALELVAVAIKHGIINTHEILPCVIGMLTSKAEGRLAEEIIKSLTASSENALKTRISEGLLFGYNLCRLFPDDSNFLGIATLYKLLSSQEKRTMMNEIVNKAVDMIDGTNPSKTIDCVALRWLMEVSCSLDFKYQWEPTAFISIMHSAMKKRALNDTIRKDAGDTLEYFLGTKKGEKIADTRPWYCAIVVIKTMHWLRRRYQVKPKIIYDEDYVIKEEKKDCKVALIDNLDLSNLPTPNEGITSLDNDILNMYAALASIVRHERATQEKYNPNIQEEEEEQNEKESSDKKEKK